MSLVVIASVVLSNLQRHERVPMVDRPCFTPTDAIGEREVHYNCSSFVSSGRRPMIILRTPFSYDLSSRTMINSVTHRRIVQVMTCRIVSIGPDGAIDCVLKVT